MKGSVKSQLKQAIPSLAIIIVMIIVASVSSDKFLRAANLRNILTQTSALAAVALAQSMVLFIGGIDMSVGSIISLGTIIMALTSGDSFFSLVLALCLVMIAGAIVGMINGIGVVVFNIPAMIITISTQVLIKGICLILMPSSGGTVNKAFVKLMKTRFGIFTTIFIVVVLMYVLGYIIMHYTRLGRSIYAIGNNETYAEQSGINTKKLITKVYIITGIIAAIAGIILSVRLSTGNALVGDAYSMDSVTAAVVGGISMNGGIGTVIGALFGAIVLSLINNIMNNLGISPYFQYIIKGTLLMVSLMLFQLKRRKK